MAREVLAFTLAHTACDALTPVGPVFSRAVPGEKSAERGERTKMGAASGYLTQLAVVFVWYELAVLGILPSASDDSALELRLVHQMFMYVVFGVVFTIWLDDLADVGAPESWCLMLVRAYQFFSTRMIACLMIIASLRTSTAWHPFWVAVGYTPSVAKGLGKDVTLKYAYYVCRVGFSVVCTAISLTGVIYWHPFRSWFHSVRDAQTRVSRSSIRKGMMRVIFWHCAFGLLLSGLWITASNSGIPRPDAVKGPKSVVSTHHVNPWIPGHKAPHAKNHGQTMITVAYGTFIAYSLNFMDDGGLWISKVLSWQIPAQIYNYFGVIYAIVALGGGTIFHPTWYTNGWTPRWATSRALDWILFVGTGQLTIVGTPLITYALLKHLKEPCFKPFTTASQAFFVQCMRHGMVSILFSGLWMIAVSTGLPMPDAKLTSMFAIPPLHKIDVNESIKMHHLDLVMSIIIMANGCAVMVVDQMLQTNYSLNQFIKVVSKHSIYSRWVYFWSAKILLHGGERFSTPNVIALLLSIKSQGNSTDGRPWLLLMVRLTELYSFTAMMLIFLVTALRVSRAGAVHLRKGGLGSVNWTTGAVKQD